MSRRILHDGRLCGLGVSYSIDQLCLEPIRNAGLDLQLYLPGLSSTITSFYRPSILSVLQVNGEASKNDRTVFSSLVR
jgi:hypothetical protein